MLDYLKTVLRDWLSGEPLQTLDLKGADSVSFNLVNASEQLRKFYATHPDISEALGVSWTPTHTGRSVTESTALTCSVVWACVRTIADTVASLPLRIIEEAPSGKRVAGNHPLDWVLHRESNPETSALRARQTMGAHLLTHGNAYARKVRRGGTGQTIGLWPWSPAETRPRRNQNTGELEYVHIENGTEVPYPASEVFHLAGLGFDGVRGYSVVTMAKHSIGLAQIQEEYVSKFFAAGGRKPYILEHPAKFRDDQQYNEFRDKWRKAYGSVETFFEAPILEGGIKLHELGMSLEDAQFLSSRQFSVPEICRWFRVQPHLVGDLTRATFANIEQQSLDFVTQTLNYWITLWEQEIDRQLLTEGEKGRYYAKHNLSALVRGDFKTRMEGYSIGLQNGFLCPDDVRDLEDWNPLPEGAGRAYHIQLNMQTLPGTGNPTVSEQAAMAKLRTPAPAPAAPAPPPPPAEKHFHHTIETPVHVHLPPNKTKAIAVRDENGRIVSIEHGE